MNAITNKSFPLYIFVLLIVGIFLSGCATLKHETFSHPKSPDGTSERSTIGDTDYFLITGPDPVVHIDTGRFVTFSVASCNRRQRIISFGPGIGFPLPIIPNLFGAIGALFPFTHRHREDGIWIAIRFDPIGRSVEQPVQLDPMLIRLKTPTGKEYTPVATASHGWFNFCGYVGYEIDDMLATAIQDAREVSSAISVEAHTIVALRFPVELSSDDQFILFIDGLTANGKTIPTLPINFESGSNWTISISLGP